ncbi:hypothetical protein GC174_12165 [bacterium]|nr:hypothetical protein [bacterium]
MKMGSNDKDALENIKEELHPDEEIQIFGRRSVLDEASGGLSLVALLFSLVFMVYIPFDLAKGLFFLVMLIATAFFINAFIQINKFRYYVVTDQRLLAFGKEGLFTIVERDAVDDIEQNDTSAIIEYEERRIKLKVLK